MKIDHVAMYVRDLEVVKDFFVRFFGAVSNDNTSVNFYRKIKS